MGAGRQGHSDRLISAFSPKGELIVTAGEDKTAKIWKSSDGSLVETLQGHSDEVCKPTFSPNGELIVTASSDKTPKIWKNSDGSLVETLQGHSGDVYSATFSPNGKLIVTAGGDKTAKIWKSSDGKGIVFTISETLGESMLFAQLCQEKELQDLGMRLVVKHTFLEIVPDQHAKKDEVSGMRKRFARSSTEPLNFGASELDEVDLQRGVAEEDGLSTNDGASKALELQSKYSDVAASGGQNPGIEIGIVDIAGMDATNDFLASLSGSLFKNLRVANEREKDGCPNGDDKLSSSGKINQAPSQMSSLVQVHSHLSLPVQLRNKRQPVELQPNIKFALPSLLGNKMGPAHCSPSKKKPPLEPEYKDDRHTTVMVRNIPNC
jgi:hypothetical protein